MTFKCFHNTKTVIDYYINKFKYKKIVAVDMTIGKGNDLYNIAKTVSFDSEIYGFDILNEAINETTNKISKLQNNNIKLILDSHCRVDRYINNDLDLAIYNLGFLPGGNKTITTNYKTVIKSLDKILKKLKPSGIILITFYPGHESGKKESEEIEEYLRNLNQKEYNILKYNFINQVNNPPYVVVIERGSIE